jgi:hypothetical protein
MSELSNLSLFFFAIAKVLGMTGIGPAIAFAILYEKFPGRAVSREKIVTSEVTATSPSRNVSWRAA